MSDRENTIAEIREWHDGKRDSFPPFTVFEAVGVMLDELDRLEREYAEERAAHNAHVTELCELEAENRKLREQLQSAQAEAEKWKRKHEECAKISMMLADRNVEQGDEIEQLRRELAEKDEVLRWYADTMNYEYKTSYLDQDAPILDDCGQRARDVLVKWAQR